MVQTPVQSLLAISSGSCVLETVTQGGFPTVLRPCSHEWREDLFARSVGLASNPESGCSRMLPKLESFGNKLRNYLWKTCCQSHVFRCLGFIIPRTILRTL